mmetsp:Transcript_5918/g.26566  ORF Transcript_5918/g.26566 Transcript_5918/m.26566 type:complete len:232 (-) Transcript_5918:338-1033(-)
MRNLASRNSSGACSAFLIATPILARASAAVVDERTSLTRPDSSLPRARTRSLVFAHHRRAPSTASSRSSIASGPVSAASRVPPGPDRADTVLNAPTSQTVHDTSVDMTLTATVPRTKGPWRLGAGGAPAACLALSNFLAARTRSRASAFRVNASRPSIGRRSASPRSSPSFGSNPGRLMTRGASPSADAPSDSPTDAPSDPPASALAFHSSVSLTVRLGSSQVLSLVATLK